MTPAETGQALAVRGRTYILAVWLAVLLPLPGFAQSLEQAASDAARRYDAKVLSAHTEERGERRVHVIKLLTREGVVKVVRVRVREDRGR